MFCPRCGSTQDDEVKFCKLCGANLYAVRQAIDIRETEEKFDWSRTWVAEMFMSAEENKRRKREIERQAGITPEMKRVTEMKAGVITASVGVGVMLILLVLMEGLILGGNVAPDAVEILSRLWIVGVIPILVGIALFFNGLVVSKKLVELSKRPTQSQLGDNAGEPRSLGAPDTSEFVPSPFSVTEGTTKHLQTQKEKR